MTRRTMLATVAALLVATGPALAGAMADDAKLADAVKEVEQRLKEKPKHQALKEWLEHARDYKSGERTDRPGEPPR